MKRIAITAIIFSTILLKARAQTYWQQKVDTKIAVRLDDEKHLLQGYEEMVYSNYSPDTLHYIYMHLWPNAYQHDHTQFAEQKYRNGQTEFYYASPSERGYIDSLQFSINGNDVDYFYGEQTPDLARIDLPVPLAPGQKMTITTPFRVKIPKVFSRLGHTGQAYFISQWFPKPAVYDRKGWHPLPYLDNGEFYSEFGDYDVTITLPENYIVMATGNLQTASENAWLDSLATAPSPQEIKRQIVTTKMVNGQKKKIVRTTDFPESAVNFKTIRYTEQNIHDFAWFADKRWQVRKDTAISPGTGKVVTTWAAYLPKQEKTWKKTNEYLRETIHAYGAHVGDYPYATIKAVAGDMKAGGGMEYPTITVIDATAGGKMVTIHEAGHNWFYGMLGTNERDHAWMDEGINTFYEEKTSQESSQRRKDSSATQSNTVSKKRNVNISLSMNTILYQLAASGNDQPIEQTSNNFREINYGLDVYYKTSAMLRWLERYMGAENFEAGMKDYFENWKFRHPYPEDFQASMQKHTDKPIGWFFDVALTTDRLIDFSLKSVQQNGDSVQVRIKNKSGQELPVLVKLYDGDSVTATGSSLPFREEVTLSLAAKEWTKVVIAPEVFDGRTQNNEYRKNGLWHKSGLQLRPFLGTNTGSKQKLFLMPAVGYNMYDGFQAGLLFHNLTWPERRIKFIVAPMYGFRSNNLIGAASAGYFIHPTGLFEEISLQIDSKTFDYDESDLNRSATIFARYFKIAPSLNFTFRKPTFISTATNVLSVKGYAISEGSFDYPVDPSDTSTIPRHFAVEGPTRMRYYGKINFTHKNQRQFNPFSYGAELQAGEDFAKLSVEGQIKINYHAPKKSLHLRIYGGKYFGFNDDFRSERYYLNSTFTGINDYLYDDTYIGRSDREGFGIHQISMREGGLKIPTPLYASPLGRSDNWLAAINIKTDLPLKNLPIRLFADAATFADAGKLNPSGNKVLFDAGVELYFFDIINIYIPVIMSKDFNVYRKSISGKTGLLDNISFSINLQQINWLKAPQSVFRLMGY